jgi:hypothetical protein
MLNASSSSSLIQACREQQCEQCGTSWLTFEYRLSELTIELLLNHFDFVVAAVSVDVFQHDAVIIPPLVGISLRHTTANTQEPTNGRGVHAEVQRCICSL